MEYLLFVVYLIFFSWLATRTRFFLASGLSKPQLTILFLLKVIAGIFYGWVGVYYGQLAQMSDTWSFHSEGLVEHAILLNNPHEYFTNIFFNPYENGMGNFFGSDQSYWNDLKSNVFIKLISIFDIFSGGYYYVNVVFYSFVVFIGPIALYRVMNEVFPGKKLWVITGIFFIPSFFYWSNGIHKEGLIATGIFLIMYSIYFSNKCRKINTGRALLFISGLLLLLLLRNFVLLLMLPAIAAWIIASIVEARALKQNRLVISPGWTFALVYTVSIVLFFATRYAIPGVDLPAAVVEKQRSFLALSGNSSIHLEAMEPTLHSFVRHTPQALAMAATRPYPSDVSHLLSLAAIIEIAVLLCLVIIFLVCHLPPIAVSRTTLYFCLFFSGSLLLAIGFTVNNLGAIVRYRSIVLPLLMTPVLAGIDWKKLGRLFAPLTNTQERPI